MEMTFPRNGNQKGDECWRSRREDGGAKVLSHGNLHLQKPGWGRGFGDSMKNSFVLFFYYFFICFCLLLLFLLSGTWAKDILPSIQNLPIVTKRHTINSHRSKLSLTLHTLLTSNLPLFKSPNGISLFHHFQFEAQAKHIIINNNILGKKEDNRKNWCFVGFI